MTRQMTDDAKHRLKLREAENAQPRLKAYLDDAGVWTIGFGHTGDDVHKDSVWTPEQCDVAFDKDTEWAEACVEQHVTVSLNDNQFGALVSFVFNIGEGAFLKSTLLKKLNAGDYSSVPGQMLLYINVRDPVTKKLTKDDGLVNRRNSEGGQWAIGSFVRSSNVVPTPPLSIWSSPRVKTLGTAVVGVSGTALTTAATQAQTLSATWHPAIYVFIALSAFAILIGFIQHHKDNS